MTIARTVRVTGRVQGVFFRAWTKEQAGRLAICGWVRNCIDGSLEAHLEGEESDVTALIERMGDGPPGAHVTSVDVSEAPSEDLARFEVRR